MSNGDMLNTVKKLIESGDPFTAKQFQTMSLTGMVELGEDIKEVRDEINKVDKAAQARICPAVLQAQKDIGKLEKKSTRNNLLVTLATGISGVVGFIFGNK